MPVRAGRCARCAPLGRGHFRIRTRCAGSLPHPGAARGHFRIRVAYSRCASGPVWPCGAQLAPSGPLCATGPAWPAVRGHFCIECCARSLPHPDAAGVTFASGCCAGSLLHPGRLFAVRKWPRLAVRCATGPAWPCGAQVAPPGPLCGVTSASGCRAGSLLHPDCPFAVRNWPRLAVRCATGPAWPCGAQVAPPGRAVRNWPRSTCDRCAPQACGGDGSVRRGH